MTVSSLRERHALDLFEPIWQRQGYTVIREPSPQQLPGFLRGLRPDAIATGANPSLVIEVAAGTGPSKEHQIRRLKSILDDQDGWRLEVVYVGSEGEPVRASSLETIEAALRLAENLADIDPSAALLRAWASIEAVARLLEPGLAEYSLGALAVVDLLVGYGHLSQEEGAELRAMAMKRNRIAHGDMDAMASSRDLKTLGSIAKQLISAASIERPSSH